MREAIKDFIIKAIVLTCIMILIPIGIAHYIDSMYIALPVMFAYGSFIALITDIK